MVQSDRKLKNLCIQSNTRRNKGNKNNIHVNIHVPKSELNLYIKIPINLKVLI